MVDDYTEIQNTFVIGVFVKFEGVQRLTVFEYTHSLSGYNVYNTE